VPFRIFAWNWEWSYYYADPQAEIVTRLPDGVELLLGFEMGGTREWFGRRIPVGEYALSCAGPGEQFLLVRDAVRGRGTTVHAKIEINTTHELCSVPNIPVIATLHTRFAALTAHGVAGVLATWTMGSRFTLNTAAMRLYLDGPDRFRDETLFLDTLARTYFGCQDTQDVLAAWRGFSLAFAHYPFSIAMLYFGPHNDAPARRLSLHFEGTPTGRSWCADAPGDDLGHALGAVQSDPAAVTLDETIAGFTAVRDGWDRALTVYRRGLGHAGGGTPDQRRHRAEELSVAEMLAVQFHSIVNVFVFYRHQRRLMAAHGLRAPCDLPPAPELLTVMAEEIANSRQALPLVVADPRLGWHQDVNGYKYDAARIQAKISAMTAEIQEAEATAAAPRCP
jgi:hypothetical protein